MLKFRPIVTISFTIVLLAAAGMVFWFNRPSSVLDEYLAATPPPVPDDTFLGEQIIPPIPVPEFDLINYSGDRVSADHFKGRVVLLTFAYTSCPDVCPIMFGRFLELQKEFSEALGEEIELVFITVDPEVDTPEHLAAHVKAMGGRWYYLTESLDVMEQVWDVFNLHVEKEGNLVSHTNLAFLIDDQGLVRVQYLGLPPASAFQADIEKILNGE